MFLVKMFEAGEMLSMLNVTNVFGQLGPEHLSYVRFPCFKHILRKERNI